MNAGSNTVSVFSVRGDQLTLRQVVGSGGSFPVSVAVHGNLVYVLNAESGGSVQGYVVAFGRLVPLPGSGPALGLEPDGDAPVHQHAGPGRLLARRLAVDRDDQGERQRHRRLRGGVFGVPVRFAGAEHAAGCGPLRRLLRPGRPSGGRRTRGDQGPVATFTLDPDGTVTQLAAVPTGESATCWIAPARGFFYASNAGSATVSGYRWPGTASSRSSGTTGTDPGTVDASASADGQFLYVQTGGNGIVDEFHVHRTARSPRSAP